jgi:hypothetical protein
MTRREAVTEILSAFGELHQRQISPTLVAVYTDALSSFTIEQLQAAGRVLLRSGEYFPKPVDFVKAIEGHPDDKAAAAWGLLVEVLRDDGAWATLEVADDPAWCHALEQVFGSWIRAGDTLPDEASPMHASLRKQFMQAYRAYQNSGRQITLPKKLAGRHEAANGDWANWRPGTDLPAQPAYVLSAGQWQQTVLVLNRQAGRFEVVKPQPQLPSGGGGLRLIGGGNATGN